MKRLIVVSLFAAFIAARISLAFADKIPFAQPSNSDKHTAGPSLGDIMGLTQLRHIKLWYAGRAENWELVSYELEQLNDTFAEAAVQYVAIPVDTIAAVQRPLASLRAAVQEKNSRKFKSGFEALTDTCNSCHLAAGISFIRIQTPMASPFSDQRFSASTPK